MERIIINHQSGKARQASKNPKIKEFLFKTHPKRNILSIRSLRLDHIIPFSISIDNSIDNFQLLTLREHNEKSGKDRTILNQMKKEGWIERVSGYSIELKRDISFLKEEYLKRFELLSK